jgi:hypothetical protein
MQPLGGLRKAMAMFSARIARSRFILLPTVRHHINWNTQRLDLREGLAHLVDNVKRHVCGIASAGSP